MYWGGMRGQIVCFSPGMVIGWGWAREALGQENKQKSVKGRQQAAVGLKAKDGDLVQGGPGSR